MNLKVEAPKWVTGIVAVVVLCALVSATYIGWLAYQVRNTTPFERDSEAYNGWMFAEGNKLTDMRECEDSDGGWTAIGIGTSEEFIAGCKRWVESD